MSDCTETKVATHGIPAICVLALLSACPSDDATGTDVGWGGTDDPTGMDAGSGDTGGTTDPGGTSGPNTSAGPTSSTSLPGDTGSTTSMGDTTDGSTSTTTDGVDDTTTTGPGTTDDGPCVPDCSMTDCGPDPVCGEPCGACSGQDVCVGGTCECQPDCGGAQCGPDGCGGSCGICNTGTCTNGTCAECTAQQAECIPDAIAQIQTCGANLQWQVEPCPEFSVCVDGSCQPVCDGYLDTQANPSVCYFPLNDGVNSGLYYYTNDVNALAPDVNVTGAVWDGVSDTPIYSASGTAWPYAWSMIGSDEVAASQFRLSQLAPPVTATWFHFRAHRTGLVQTSYPTRYNVAASNGGIFASAQVFANYVWSNHSIQVASPYVQQYSSTGWNFNMMSPIGDGFGHVPDAVELSWFMLEVVP